MDIGGQLSCFTFFTKTKQNKTLEVQSNFTGLCHLKKKKKEKENTCYSKTKNNKQKISDVELSFLALKTVQFDTVLVYTFKPKKN